MELTVNNRTYDLDVDPSRPLLFVLRDALDLTGAKYGCGEGQCGACTVLLDGRAIRSCITPVSQAAGKPIVTIEGLEQNGQLHPLQTAFLAENAMQCGYCTSGMIMNAVGLLNRGGSMTDDAIRRAMDGNICRCGTYSRIIAAIRRAATASAEADDAR